MVVPLGPQPTGAQMSLPRTVADVLSEQVTPEVEGIDRIYLKCLRRPVAAGTRGGSFPPLSSRPPVCLQRPDDPISKTFVAAIEQLARRERIPVVLFRKGQRKEDIAAGYLRKCTRPEGVVFIGKAQEKTPVFRTERRNEKHRRQLSVAGAIHRQGQPVLCLLPGPRFRTLLPEVQHLLPV